MSHSNRLGVAAALVDGVVVSGDVSVSNGSIQAVGLPPAAGSAIAVPGFVDWQVNGFGGVHLGVADAAGYSAAGEALARAGIVWTTPTLCSMEPADYAAALAELSGVRASDPDCGFTGAHLEGPFLSSSWKGAHSERTLIAGSAGTRRDVVDRLLTAGPVAMMTLAPEQPGSMALVSHLQMAGVVVSIGHSDATAEVCRDAGALGAAAVTHCWNAHRRLGSRDPGPAGWALSTPGVTVGLIADGIHVSPEVLALTFSAAIGRIALTTDAIAPAGTDATDWSFGPEGRSVSVAGGAARLGDGTLAGSVATPTMMIRVLEAAGVGFEETMWALSAPQAKVLGLGEWRMRPGDPAHITVLAADHSVSQAWRSGSRIQ